MVSNNESISPELKDESSLGNKNNKRLLTLATNDLSKQVSLLSNNNLNRSGNKPTPRNTPRTSHLSLPSPHDNEDKLIPNKTLVPRVHPMQAKTNHKLHLSHMSLPIYISSALPLSIQNWDEKTKKLLSCNSILVQKCTKNLESVCEYIGGETVTKKCVLDFIDELFFINDYFPISGIKMDLPKIITELTYLVYNKPKSVISILNVNNISESVNKINYHFNHSIKRVHKLIDEAYKEQLEKGISSAKKAKHIAIPIAISRILILPVGRMLEALIPSIIEEFVNEDNPYSRSLKAGLKLLHQSDELKSAIEEIHLPEDLLSNSALLIRATLNLTNKTELNDAHARRTALSALLTHMRQGQTGSCFASFIAIELQSINPMGAISDFKQLLEEGKLLRKVNNQNHDFPYLMKTEILKTNAEWKITGLGKIHTDSVHYLWELPGIQSVCHYLSVPCKEYVLEYLKPLCSDDKTIVITIDQLIDDLAFKYPCEREHLEIIFSSSTQHPLLSIWGNSIAGMAEGLSGSMLKSALIQSIHYLIKKAAKTNGCLDSLNKYEILSKIENAVMQRAHYLYDPTLTLKNILKGAFVLYDSHNSKDFNKWTKIGSSPEFLKYLESLLESVCLCLENNEMDHLKSIILKELSEDAFINSLLKKYHRENQNTPLNSDSIKFLRYTPWINSIGNDPQMVLKVYHETENTYTIKQIMPTSADELLHLLHKILQKIPYDRRKKYLSHGEYFLPLRIKGFHVFSLLVCHPSMQPLLLSDEKQKYSTDLITSLSKIQITSQVKLLIKEYCLSIVEKKHMKAMTEKLKMLKKKYATQQLRDFLIEILREYKPIHYKDEDLVLDVDLKILEFLPKSIRSEWESSIIHFADTNWQSEIQDIHYGIGINPGSGKIEILNVLGNGQIYKFLDQNQFLNGKVWELYLDL